MKTNRKIALGALIFLLTSIIWTQLVKPFCDQWFLEREKKAAAKIVAQTKTTDVSKPITERKWILSWRKLPETKGVNPSVRTNSFNAVIMKCDRFEFKIFGYYNNHGNTDGFIMYWDKAASPDYGSWSQKSPPLQGTWFLELVTDNLFTGWVRNTKGEESSLWLRAID